MEWRPKCKSEYYKRLRKAYTEHSDINSSMIFYSPSPRVLEIKTKVNKWSIIKLKNFVQQRKSWTKWKGIVSHRMGESIYKLSYWQEIFKILKQLMQLNTKKLTNPGRKSK